MYRRQSELDNLNRWVSSDENHVSFAKCLLLVYEKAINIQFQDYLDKMQQTAV